MLNGLAICLLLTTLATAGVFTPTPAKPKSQQNDVIVKEGHRAVMVEYETDDGGSNTKVLISPEDPHHLGVKEKISDKAENAKEKLKETASFILPNGKEEKDEEISYKSDKTRTPRELVCDAYGKCKHKIVSALGKTKEVEEGAKETVGNMKDVVSDKAHEAMEKVEEVSVKAKEKANGAKEDVMEKAQELKQGAMEKLKKGAKDVVDSTKKVNEDVKQNASVMIEAAKRKGKEAEEKLKDGAYKMKEEGKKEMKDILRRGRGVIYDAFTYSFPKESVASSFRIMQLLGFSMAFGMSIWVTFISSYVLARVLPRQQFAMVQSKIYPLYFKAMSYSIGLALVAHLLNIRSKLFSNAAEFLQGFGLLASLSMALANLWYLEPRATKVMFERMKLEKEEARGLVDLSATAEPPGSKVGAADPTVTVTRATTTTPLTGMATTTTTTTVPPKSTQKTGGDASSSAAAMGELVRLSELLKRLNSTSSFLNVLTLMFLTFHLVHLGQGGLHSQLLC